MGNGADLFLAKVFRAKLLDTFCQEGLELPLSYPDTWVVDVKSVGTGEKALVYLGRYLSKDAIQEKDIIACDNGQVTFRYQESKTEPWLGSENALSSPVVVAQP